MVTFPFRIYDGKIVIMLCAFFYCWNVGLVMNASLSDNLAGLEKLNGFCYFLVNGFAIC